MIHRAVRVSIVVLLALAVLLPLMAANFLLYPGENLWLAPRYNLQDLGGSGEPILFVEVGTSMDNCLCASAQAAMAKGRVHVLKLPEGLSDADARELVLMAVNDLGLGKVWVVSAGDTLPACCELARSLESVMKVYDATEDLAYNLPPVEIAQKVIAYIAGNSDTRTWREGRYHRGVDWGGRTLEN